MVRKSDAKSARQRSVIQIGVMGVVMGVVLFDSSGHLDWTAGWALLAITVINAAVMALKLSPELLEERSHIREGAKRWDLVLSPLSAIVGPMVIMIVAGLDVRFGWSAPFPVGLQVAAIAMMIVGIYIVNWAAITNEFLSTVVRIQKDRAHAVVTSGPYQCVRHPFYCGMIISDFSMPLILGSFVAIIPAFITVAVLIVRTVLEDRTLHEELPGYKEYTQQVRYRLVPGMW